MVSIKGKTLKTKQDIEAKKKPFATDYERVVALAKEKRDKLSLEFKRRKPVTTAKDGPLQFWADEAAAPILGTFNTKRNQMMEELGNIEASLLTTEQKKGRVKEEMDRYIEELEVLGRSGLAFLESTMLKKPRQTKASIAKIMASVDNFVKCQTTKNGGAVAAIYEGFTTGTGLSPSHIKIMDAAIMDPNVYVSDSALAMLSLCKAGTRKEYTKRFIKNHPKYVVILLERGSLHGAYPPNEFMEYVRMAKKSKYEKTRNYANEILKKDPEKLTAILNNRYQTQKIVKDLTKSLGYPGAKGGAQKYLNARGAGLFFAHVASVSAVIANVIANRELLKNDKAEFLKNPSMIGGILTLLWLNQRSKGETLPSFFEAKEKKVARKRLEDLAKLNDVADRSEVLGPFLSKNAKGDEADNKEMLIKFAKHLKTKSTVLGVKPTFAKYHEWLLENKKGPIINAMTSSSGHDDDIGTLVQVIQDLAIGNPQQLDEAINEANIKT